jgi:predicted enzyme related to lactoylglutathione lyase
MSLFKSVNVVSLEVTDWEAAKKWYREVLEWPVDFSSDEAGWEEYALDNKSHVSISRSDHATTHTLGAPEGAGGTTLVLSVQDAHAATAALKKKGVKCDEVVTIPGMVTYGTFYDPFGNRIQFVEIAPPA